MHIKSHLSFDVVAVDAADNVTCLVEVTAPTPELVAARPGQGVIVVLDRSGSMSGEPLTTSKQSISTIVRRLAPQDVFGLVVFDDDADVVVPATLMSSVDTDDILRRIDSVQPGGSTDLFGGYALGIREAERMVTSGAATTVTVLLVSDGHANAGEKDPNILNQFATGAYDRARITTSTLGYGVGYDESLLEAVTRGGQGTHAFAPNPDDASQAFSEVVTDLLDKSVIGAQMRITPQLGLVDAIRIQGALPNYADGNSVVVTLGDMYAGETRKVLFRLGVPALTNLGLATVADAVFEYTALPELQAHTVTCPIAVNVVPGDAAAGRIPNPVVEVEELLAVISAEKLAVAQDLRAGDSKTAQTRLSSSLTSLNEKRKDLKQRNVEDSLTQQLDDVARELLELSRVVIDNDVQYSSKSMMQSYASSSRNKPRRQQPSSGSSSTH